MANWKKVIVSGSTAALAAANVDGTVTANAFSGDGSNLTNVPAGSINIESFTDGTGITILGTDKLILSDGGTEKFVKVEQLFDSSDFDTEVTANSAVTANTAKVTNVSTDLSITGTTGARTIVSSDGTDAIIPVATTLVSGVMSKAIFDEHTANNAKVTNVSTNLSNSVTATSVKIASSDGDNTSLVAATDSAAGIMTAAMFESFEANTAKTGITTGQASAITTNTNKVGITTGQAEAITANTSKTGITTGQASAITANTNKVGITTGQASAITANTNKVTFPGLGTTAAKALAGNTTTISNAQASAITTNSGKLSLTETNLVEVMGQDLGGNFTIGNQASDTAAFTGPVTVGQTLTVSKDVSCNNLTVDGNLDVNGTTTTIDTTNLAVADKFIELNRGANSNADGGIVINGAANKSFGWSNTAARWAFDFTGATAGQATITSDAFVAAVVTSDDSNYRKNGNIRIDSGDIYIYTE